MVYRKSLICGLAAVVTGVAVVTSVAAEAMSREESRTSPKPRLIVLTDMTSIQSGVREPDDAQSMIQLMLYANEFDIEGLIAGSGLRHGHVVRPQNIRKIVDAYGKVRPNLVQHDKNYPTADSLRQVIKSGQPIADEHMPVYKSIGPGKDTQASRWIIQRVDKPDIRPVWITIWGGSADLAQALWTVKHTRSPARVKEFVSKIRVIASGDQDTTGPWIKSHFPGLFYATRIWGGRGLYRGGDQRLVSSEWVQEHIKGHGVLGDLYPDYRGKDIWSYKIGEVEGVKGGDSVSYMGLIDNGLNVRNHLTWENWGGRLRQQANSNRYHDAIDRVAGYRSDISPYLAAVYRWRPDFQAALAARFDWCIKPYSEANHAPVGNNSLVRIRDTTSGQTVKLQSGNWYDPDGDKLTFHWQTLKEESSYPKNIAIFTKYPQSGRRWPVPKYQGSERTTAAKNYSRTARLIAPAVQRPRSVHALLTVTDNGNPALSSYKRFNLIIHPE